MDCSIPPDVSVIRAFGNETCKDSGRSMDSVLQRRIRIILRRSEQTDRCQGIEHTSPMD